MSPAQRRLCGQNRISASLGLPLIVRQPPCLRTNECRFQAFFVSKYEMPPGARRSGPGPVTPDRQGQKRGMTLCQKTVPTPDSPRPARLPAASAPRQSGVPQQCGPSRKAEEYTRRFCRSRVQRPYSPRFCQTGSAPPHAALILTRENQRETDMLRATPPNAKALELQGLSSRSNC